MSPRRLGPVLIGINVNNFELKHWSFQMSTFINKSNIFHTLILRILDTNDSYHRLKLHTSLKKDDSVEIRYIKTLTPSAGFQMSANTLEANVVLYLLEAVVVYELNRIEMIEFYYLKSQQ